MRFFKYLIFIIISLFSTYTFSSQYDDTCKASIPSGSILLSAYLSSPTNLVCVYGYTGSSNEFRKNVPYDSQPKECFYPDYKIVSQPITSLKKVMCLPINGAICKYTGDPTGVPVVNGSITTTFSSVSKTPDPTCKEELVNPPCDPKNPYGGCFTPADDGCTRQFNGSIECPAETSPPIEKGCNGATYCDRPPQGCGDGYVSGSFNGKLLCVKTSPSDGSGNGGDGEDDGTGTGSNSTDGTGTSTSTGTETSTTTNSDGSSTTTNTTTNNTTVNNFKIDFSPVVNAVKQVSADIKNLKNELLTSISELTKKLDTTNTKIDETNSKLDTSNTSLTSIKDSSLRQEQLLKDIRDKTNSDLPASSASTDMTETNGYLKDIKDWLSSDTDLPENESPQIQEFDVGQYEKSYVSWNSACPADVQVPISMMGQSSTLVLKWQPLCMLLDKIKWAIVACAYFAAAYIILGMR
jgi:hypothetical protein